MKSQGYGVLIIIATMLVVVAGVGMWFDTSDIVGNIITTTTTIIGAVAIWIQFKKDKEVSMAGFIIEINKVFYERGNGDLLGWLDDNGMGDNPKPIPADLQKKVLTYIRWARDVANLVNRKVVSLDGVDSPLGYKFFLILNNPYVQEMEIKKYSEFYHPIFEAHRMWRKFRQKVGEPLVQEKFDLSNLREYKDYFSKKA